MVVEDARLVSVLPTVLASGEPLRRIRYLQVFGLPKNESSVLSGELSLLAGG